MLVLQFDPSKIPRTISRQGWRKIWRWKRVTEKRLSEEFQKQHEAFVATGHLWPEHVRAEYLDKLVNPPLLLGPYQDAEN